MSRPGPDEAATPAAPTDPDVDRPAPQVAPTPEWFGEPSAPPVSTGSGADGRLEASAVGDDEAALDEGFSPHGTVSTGALPTEVLPTGSGADGPLEAAARREAAAGSLAGSLDDPTVEVAPAGAELPPPATAGLADDVIAPVSPGPAGPAPGGDAMHREPPTSRLRAGGETVLHALRGFAAHRPAAFLAVAGLAGVLGSRLAAASRRGRGGSRGRRR